MLIKEILQMFKVDNILKVLNKYIDLPRVVQILEITAWFTPHNAKFIAQMLTGAAVIISIIAGGVLLYKDPINTWVFLRDKLLILKDSIPPLDDETILIETSTDANQTRIRHPSWFTYIDGQIMSIWASTLSLFTVENASNILRMSLNVLERSSHLALKIGNFVCEHWITLSTMTISMPFIAKFNIFYVNTLYDTIKGPLTIRYTELMELISLLSLSYAQLENTIGMFVRSIFGGFSEVLVFPIKITLNSIILLIQTLETIIGYTFKKIRWLYDRFSEFMDWIISFFRPPAPQNPGGNGGNLPGNEGGGGGGSGRSSPIAAVAVVGTGVGLAAGAAAFSQGWNPLGSILPPSALYVPPVQQPPQNLINTLPPVDFIDQLPLDVIATEIGILKVLTCVVLTTSVFIVTTLVKC